MVACGPRLVIAGSAAPSITQRPSTPRTRHRGSSTARSSESPPIGAVAQRCCDVDQSGSAGGSATGHSSRARSLPRRSAAASAGELS